MLVTFCCQAYCKGQSSIKPVSKTSEDHLWEKIYSLCLKVEDKVITMQRYIHQNPEPGNCEFGAARLIADHLRSLGLEVQTGVAHTGVVGILKGKAESPVIARHYSCRSVAYVFLGSAIIIIIYTCKINFRNLLHS